MKEQYIKVGQGFLIVYSVTQRSSWDKAKQERDLILRGKDEENWYPMVFLVNIFFLLFLWEKNWLLILDKKGNKVDLEKQRQVPTEEASNFCKSVGVPFLEGSAKTRMNVEEAFYQLVKEIRRYKEQHSNEEKEEKKKEKRCILIWWWSNGAPFVFCLLKM